MNNLYSKFQPLEQSRWNQANIDTQFYAGNQSFINRQYNFTSTSMFQFYYFNLMQQPVNLITGYQRQHRKSINYFPADGSDPDTTDQYTRVMTNIINRSDIHEVFSKSCELACVAGLNLLQPYLDFKGDDPAQGELKVKLWEYNSFIVDPYFRNADMSDANFVWCQEYISKQEADLRFPDKAKNIRPLSGTPQRYGRFYFLPENFNMAQNDLLVLSYIWYKTTKKKKRLYSRTLNQFFDFAGGEDNLDNILRSVGDFEEVSVMVPCWKCAVVLNEQLMFNGDNPLGVDIDCPFIPVYWNYEPHINNMDLRSRSLIFPMRSPQFLFNHKIITNNDIASATINAGWKRKSGAVANEDNLKRAGQGWDIIINEGYEMTDCEKIVPSAVPESDLALAQQMSDLIFQVSGINLENWSGQNDKQISSLTALIKQSANLMVFQKYFDQWDYSLRLLGERMLQVVLYNWNAAKIKNLIGEEPTAFFFSRIFAKYKTIVEEGLLTPTQKNLQAQQMLEINERFGREVIPASMIIKDMNLQGKNEIVNYLQQQEQQMAAAQAEAQNIQHTVEEMKMRELMAKIHNLLSQARERDSRSESNIGLFEERMSNISKNHAMAAKEKMAALQQLLETINTFGELEVKYGADQLGEIKEDEEEREKEDRKKVEEAEAAKNYIEDMMASQLQGQQNAPQQQQPMV